MRLSGLIAPREREFFDLFEEAGGNILRAAGLLEEMLESYPDRSDLAREILICEQEGDRITHDIIRRLNQTFVTPIDREDIYALASALDDVVKRGGQRVDVQAGGRPHGRAGSAELTGETGSRTRNVAPAPGMASTSTRPPCASTR